MDYVEPGTRVQRYGAMENVLWVVMEVGTGRGGNPVAVIRAEATLDPDMEATPVSYLQVTTEAIANLVTDPMWDLNEDYAQSAA